MVGIFVYVRDGPQTQTVVVNIAIRSLPTLDTRGRKPVIKNTPSPVSSCPRLSSVLQFEQTQQNVGIRSLQVNLPGHRSAQMKRESQSGGACGKDSRTDQMEIPPCPGLASLQPSRSTTLPVCALLHTPLISESLPPTAGRIM